MRQPFTASCQSANPTQPSQSDNPTPTESLLPSGERREEIGEHAAACNCACLQAARADFFTAKVSAAFNAYCIREVRHCAAGLAVDYGAADHATRLLSPPPAH